MEWTKHLTIRNFLLVTIILVLPFVFISIRKIYLLLALLAVNAATAYLKKRFLISTYLSKFSIIMHISHAVEFITFGAVLAGFLFGPISGVITGAVGILSTYIFEKRLSKYIVLTIPLYILIGLTSPYLRSMGIVRAGIAMSLFYNLALNIFLVIFFRAKFFKMLSFSAVNILFNIYVFSGAGPVIVRIFSA